MPKQFISLLLTRPDTRPTEAYAAVLTALDEAGKRHTMAFINPSATGLEALYHRAMAVYEGSTAIWPLYSLDCTPIEHG